MALIDYIKWYDEVLPETTLSNIYKVVQNLDYADAPINGTNEKGESVDIVNKEVRNVTSRPLCVNDKRLTVQSIHNMMRNRFSSCLEIYQREVQRESCVNSQHHFDMQILRYESGGFYSFHSDHCASYPRTLSFIFFVNDNYEGGDLDFKLENNEIVKINKTKNRLLVWPSNFLYPHSVVPVTSGVRFTIVGWIL